MKKTYHVEALGCSDCAMEIVEKLEKLNYFQEVHINYDTKDITIVSKNDLSQSQVDMMVESIVSNNHCHNHQFLNLQNTITEEFNFTDIDCPNCAAKVERALNKNEQIIDAKVNFMNKKIIITHLNNVEVYAIVSKIVSTVEKGACVIPVTEKSEAKTTKRKVKVSRVLLLIGLVLYVGAILLKFLYADNWYVYSVFVVSYLLISYDIIYKSFYGFFHGDIFNENLLMVIASLGALIIREPIEAIMVIILYKIGEHFQDLATEKSKKAIQGLLDVRSNEVMLKNGTVRNIKDVEVGEIITIKAGERIPLDGVIKQGQTEVDMKTLTGESIPVALEEGSEILSGSVNLTKVIDIEVTKKDNESTISKVLKLVEDASNQKSKTEEFITKFARIYTPAILAFAILLGLFQGFILHIPALETINNVLIILVIACPCALIISIPLGYFAGIGRASADGILVKGGNYLEALTKAKIFVFDKTGTITKGNFKVTAVKPMNGFTEEELLKVVAGAEQYSLHPIAKSIQEAYGKEVQNTTTPQVEEISGAGLKVLINKQQVLVGNDKLMTKFKITYPEILSVGTILHVAIDGKYAGYITINDEIKEQSPSLIASLKARGHKTIMLSGDKTAVASEVGIAVGIDEVRAELLPSGKYDALKDIIKDKKGNVVYVGDGINDTPSLKLADVGIAMGGVGSDSAKECADLVIMNDDLNKIVDAITIAKHTRRIVIENIIFALIVKVTAVILGATGILGSYGMLVGVFADVGVCLLAILNVLRITKMRIKTKKQ